MISTHDAFGYFADAYGITFIAPQGVSTEAEATARDVARIITQIKAQKIPAVFLENVSDPRLMRRISQESGARLGPATQLADVEQRGAEAAKALGLGDNPTMAQLRAVSAQTLAGAEATRRGFGSPVDGKFQTAATVEIRCSFQP